MNLLNVSALEIARRIAEKQISCVDVVQFYIDRIKQYAALNCISDLFESEALIQARKLDLLTAKGKQLSPFHGIPIVLKDNLHVQGYITHAGTVYLDHIAHKNCALFNKLESLGFIILAKAKMTELAFGLSGQNPLQGTPHNPWSKQVLSPGGSSSGSAVAVAAGLCPIAIGGDTGGSIRTPAALNGVLGFKPTAHKINARGAIPLAQSLDSLGPIALASEDIIEFYQLLKQDQSHLAVMPLNSIYYLDEKDFPNPLATEILQLWRQHLQALQQKGIQLRAWQKPKDFDFAHLSDLTSTIIAYESYHNHGKAAENKQNKMWEVVRQRVLRGKDIAVSEYQLALAQRLEYQQAFAESLGGDACLVLPVSPIFASALDPEDQGFRHVGDYTRPFNYLDAPGVAYPIGFSTEQLPIGVQLVAAQGKDQLLLQHLQQLTTTLSLAGRVADLA
ncbi:amidase [Acinetobacter larvae]|uniref:Amidase domain-containing protein n=1 Tax=Acinetobacter larvae TaxID=1789224 RepID=A0A1B2LY71_9GAMM|nr:amidase [Acinetobacter larvae]AOA57894.1 hypothetical protein BFG52_05695 [Acinetobacter larvae]